MEGFGNGAVFIHSTISLANLYSINEDQILIGTKGTGFGYLWKYRARTRLQVNLKFVFPTTLRACLCLFSIEVELMW